MNRSILQSLVSSGRAVRRGVVVVLIFAALAVKATAAGETAPDADFPTVSAEGKPMLVTVLALAGALIGMEQACSWRLRVIRRQTADHQRLAAGLPPISAADLPQAS